VPKVVIVCGRIHIALHHPPDARVHVLCNHFAVVMCARCYSVFIAMCSTQCRPGSTAALMTYDTKVKYKGHYKLFVQLNNDQLHLSSQFVDPDGQSYQEPDEAHQEFWTTVRCDLTAWICLCRVVYSTFKVLHVSILMPPVVVYHPNSSKCAIIEY